jgi:excisionase family DNA binding protein
MVRYLSIKEAAAQVGVSVNTMKRWVRHGLRHSRIGRIIRIHPDDLLAYMNKHSVSNELTPKGIIDSMLNLR